MKFSIKTYPKLNIYTDGACWCNGSPQALSSYAFICKENGEQDAGCGGFEGKHTNNTAELSAIINALKYAKGKTNFLFIHSDSLYAGNSIFTWPLKKGKKNYELIEKGKLLLQDFEFVQFVFVRGHDGDILNEKADCLATQWLKDNYDQKIYGVDL